MKDQERWTALAGLLRRQRVVVLNQRSRAQFARDRGVSDSVIADLESARRDNYDADTLVSLEVWYSLTPSDLRGVLGDMYPVKEVVTPHEVATIHSQQGKGSDPIAELETSIKDIRIMLDAMAERLDEYHQQRGE